MKIMFFLSFFKFSEFYLNGLSLGQRPKETKQSFEFQLFFYFFFPYFPRSLLGWGYLYVVVVVSGDSLFIKNGKSLYNKKMPK